MATTSKTAPTITLPLLNSIPEELISKFEPTYVSYYNQYSAGRLATHQVPIEAYRADPSKYTISYGRELIPQGSLKITDQKCPVKGGEITVRVFEPEPAGNGTRPVYINFHGGGWVFGGLATDFDFCKRVANETGAVVFDVDYRLAPEYKFPIPVDDCWEAVNWVCSFSFLLSSITLRGVC
jgi:acetyl esterase/lipase